MDIKTHQAVVVLHTYSLEWWRNAHNILNSTCSREDIFMVLNNSLVLAPELYNFLSESNETTISGIVRCYLIHNSALFLFACLHITYMYVRKMEISINLQCTIDCRKV